MSLAGKINKLDQKIQAFISKTLDIETEHFKKVYQNLQKELMEIQDDLSAVYATSKQLYLQNRSKIFFPADELYLPTIASNYFHKITSEKCQIQGEIKEKLEEIWKHYFLAMADKEYKKGNLTNVLLNIEQVLKQCPANRDAYEILDRLKTNLSGEENDDDQRLYKKVDNIENLFKFKYCSYISHEDLKRPFSIVVQERGELILTSDPISGKIFRFTQSGKYIGAIDNGFKTPLGLIYESENSFWVCDSDNRRLVRMGADGRQKEVLMLDKLFQKSPYVYPLIGFIKDNHFYLVNNKKEGGGRVLVKMSLNKPHEWNKIIPSDMGLRITGLAVWENYFMFSEYFSSGMTKVELKEGIMTMVDEFISNYYLKQLVCYDRWLFAATDHDIIKYDLAYNRVVFCISYKTLFRDDCEEILGLTVCSHPEGNTQFLYLSTYNQSDNRGHIYINEI